MVVDDHPLFLDGLLQVLQQSDKNLVPLQVSSADAALEVLAENPNFDLILVDINMPGMDGIDLLTTLVEREIWVPAVVISAQDNPRSIIQALDAGALGFIPKSFNANQLLGALKQIFQGEVFLPENIAKQIEQLRRAENGKRQHTRNGEDYGITPRQHRVLQLLVKGYSNRTIATTLNLSEHTVKSHLKSIFANLGTTNRTECVQKAEQLGLVPPQN